MLVRMIFCLSREVPRRRRGLASSRKDVHCMDEERLCSSLPAAKLRFALMYGFEVLQNFLAGKPE